MFIRVGMFAALLAENTKLKAEMITFKKLYSELEVRPLESEMSALKTQQKLDQADFSSVIESTSRNGMLSLLEMMTSRCT